MKGIFIMYDFSLVCYFDILLRTFLGILFFCMLIKKADESGINSSRHDHQPKLKNRVSDSVEAANHQPSTIIFFNYCVFVYAVALSLHSGAAKYEHNQKKKICGFLLHDHQPIRNFRTSESAEAGDHQPITV